MSSGLVRACGCAGLALAVLAGCGSGVYEQRFQNTQLLYRRFSMRNEHLTAPAWDDKGGISLRIPKGFVEIEDVKPPPPAEGEIAIDVPDEDERQPRMLGLILPGMRGAFRQGDDFNFLYILSSKDVKPPEGMAESVIEQPGTNPALFNADICKILADTIGNPEFDYTRCVQQQFPQSTQPFVATVTYKSAVLYHVQQAEDGRTLEWKLNLYFYEGREQGVQVAILTVEPKDKAGSFSNAMDLSLETLEVDEATFRSKGGPVGTTPGGAF